MTSEVRRNDNPPFPTHARSDMNDICLHIMPRGRVLQSEDLYSVVCVDLRLQHLRFTSNIVIYPSKNHNIGRESQLWAEPTGTMMESFLAHHEVRARHPRC